MTQEQVQELLRPRVKCIAPDTSRKYEIGDIFYKHVFPGSDSGMSCYITNLEFPLEGKNLITEFAENMPHLFQRLNWWDDREVNEMPEYLKIKDRVYRIAIWEKYFGWLPVERDPIDESFRLAHHFDKGLPATEQDYLNYKNNL